MPKTLVINCSLKTKSEALVAAIRKFSDVEVAQYTAFHTGFRLSKEIDAVVVSGSGARIVDPNDRQLFAGVADFIKLTEFPTLGICFGHQLLCWAFGAKVGCLANPVLDQFEQIHVVEADSLFGGFKEKQAVLFSENHYDYVLKDGLGKAGFVLLADSPSCEVEAVRHSSKPFYGVQFHPERIELKGEKHPEGHGLLENFYTNVVKR
jgi:GMP synthase-like glutamine amidotransferase